MAQFTELHPLSMAGSADHEFESSVCLGSALGMDGPVVGGTQLPCVEFCQLDVCLTPRFSLMSIVCQHCSMLANFPKVGNINDMNHFGLFSPHKDDVL